MHSFWLDRVTQPQLEAMLQHLRATGNQVEPFINPEVTHPPCWIVRGSGIVAEVIYGAQEQGVRVNIHSKPFLVPASMIEQKVREALKMARG